MSAIASQIGENQPNPAAGDHELTHSESGVELKTLLKLIDNVIEMSPATDDEPSSAENLNFPPDPSRFKVSNTTTTEIPVPGFVTLSETLLVPVKKYPKYNFVGRILGPRGMTVKQLEKETGCKIFVRGRASSVAANPICKPKRPNNGAIPPKPSLSNISKCALTEEPLHVYIECYDSPSRAEQKMCHAVSIIQDLLSPPADGKDELKRQQLVDISLINGTYRATSASNEHVRQYHRGRQTVDPTSHPILDLQPLSMDQGFGAQNQGNGDLGAVYGIAQQRRVWQKPRGPDASSEEYAKSVSSREFVSDIVSKTKNSPVKGKPTSSDSLFQLSDSVVSETMKVAQNLLASHNYLTSDVTASTTKEPQILKTIPLMNPKIQKIQNQNPSRHQNRHYGSGDFPPLLNFSIPPPPIVAPPPLTPSQMYRNHPFPPMEYQMCFMFPPPPPPKNFAAPRRF
ncbi:unnamed protein product [Caenorhabditis nigoni]